MADAAPLPYAVTTATAVVSGSDCGRENSTDAGSGDEAALKYGEPMEYPDDLFDRNADDEDEAFVYRHLRSGVEEEVPFRREGTVHVPQKPIEVKKKLQRERVRGVGRISGRSERQGNSGAPPPPTRERSDLERARMLKPRSSDAILSCPCCFNIMCMDCQRHERHKNQYRAMFVMNIGVDWQRRLVYDEARRELVEGGTVEISRSASLAPLEPVLACIPRDDHHTEEEEKGEEFYFPVYCDNCRTEVAALSMTDEVYHFHGCLASG